MRRAILLCLLGVAAAASAAPERLGFGANFARQLNGPNRVELFSGATWKLFDDVEVDATARLGTTERAFHTLEWAGQARYALLPFVFPTLRFHNSSQLAYGTHHTGLFPHLSLAGSPFDGLALFFRFGWFLRWVSLQSSFPVPFWGGTSYYEHDMAFSLGFDVSPLAGWNFAVSAGTFDDWDVHNFNHPILLLALQRRIEDKAIGIFFRNDFLLGFGRTQAWRAGVTLHLFQIKPD